MVSPGAPVWPGSGPELAAYDLLTNLLLSNNPKITRPAKINKHKTCCLIREIKSNLILFMSLYSKLSRQEKQFLALTGMNLHQFQELLPLFTKVERRLQKARKSKVVVTGETRQRAIGGGAKFANTLEDRLLMVLIYYRLYLTQDFMTLLFKATNKSVICRNIQLMREVFERVLPVPERARRRILSMAKGEGKRRQKKISTVEEFVQSYPELTFLIDGIEQEKRKPKDKDKRRDDYSGKKKKHTRKQIVTGTPAGIIVDQSPSVGGRAHDFKVFQADCEQRPQVIEEFAEVRASLYGDSGFQGIEELGLPFEMRITKRGRRNHPLTLEEKKINRLRNQTRVEIEHTFSRRKKYRIAAEVYRNRDEDYDRIMNIVSGLVNLRAYDRIFQKTGVKI